MSIEELKNILSKDLIENLIMPIISVVIGGYITIISNNKNNKSQALINLKINLWNELSKKVEEIESIIFSMENIVLKYTKDKINRDELYYSNIKEDEKSIVIEELSKEILVKVEEINSIVVQISKKLDYSIIAIPDSKLNLVSISEMSRLDIKELKSRLSDKSIGYNILIISGLYTAYYQMYSGLQLTLLADLSEKRKIKKVNKIMKKFNINEI